VQMKNEDAVKRIVVASSPRAGDHIKVISPRMGLAGKAALNAGAAPFMILGNGQVSPPVSPRNLHTPGFVVPPPPPHSFQFPAPPLPVGGASNFLPVPSGNQGPGLMINTNLTPISMGGGGGKDQQLNQQFNINNNNRSPMFSPTHSPPFQAQQFQNFSH